MIMSGQARPELEGRVLVTATRMHAVACGCSHNHTKATTQPGTASRREDLVDPFSTPPHVVLQDTLASRRHRVKQARISLAQKAARTRKRRTRTRRKLQSPPPPPFETQPKPVLNSGEWSVVRKRPNVRQSPGRKCLTLSNQPLHPQPNQKQPKRVRKHNSTCPICGRSLRPV